MRTRKFARKKVAKTVFLIICEGVTEKEYVEALKLHYRLPITIKTKVSGNKINKRLVNQYISELGLEKGDSYRVFFMYDADVEDMVGKLTKLEGTLILSNPCIELWFLLHVRSCRKSTESTSIVKELCASHSIWTNYQKGFFNIEQTKFLIEHLPMACAKAKQLEWPRNPSSNVWILIDAMEKEKNG